MSNQNDLTSKRPIIMKSGKEMQNYVKFVSFCFNLKYTG